MRLAGRGWYTFAVMKHARKESVAREVEKLYHVHVTAARMVAVHGKVRRTGKKMVSTKRADWKKVMVLLKPGEHIDAFEVTQEPAEAPKESASVKTTADEGKKLETQQKGKVKK